MKYTSTAPSHIKMDVRPTEREQRWFAHIDRHGPQSSEFLYELTCDSHRCRDTALRRLKALRDAGYLRLPPQQRHIAKADFNPYVYDLTKLGWEMLAEHQNLERHCRPTGHWWHGYWVSAVSSAIEISATRTGFTYIPAAQILAIKSVPMGIPVERTKLIPDQLFAIKYPDGFRAFALEVDLGTEPVRSNAARKSLQRSVEQYRQVLDQRLYQRHYGLKSNLGVIWVFKSTARRVQFRKLFAKTDSRFLSTTISTSFPHTSDLKALKNCWL